MEELQKIADSSDILKRNRGRRGLDILNHMRKNSKDDVIIVTNDFEDISEVDSKLVKLAREKNYKIVTNDYNLNKVAELQGVAVLNINDLEPVHRKRGSGHHYICITNFCRKNDICKIGK